jgi:hypothetical protein
MSLSIRPNNNPNHHLWMNNGSWWLQLTEHRDDYTKQRIRRPLGTKDVIQARRRRDALMANWNRKEAA